MFETGTLIYRKYLLKSKYFEMENSSGSLAIKVIITLTVTISAMAVISSYRFAKLITKPAPADVFYKSISLNQFQFSYFFVQKLFKFEFQAKEFVYHKAQFVVNVKLKWHYLRFDVIQVQERNASFSSHMCIL